MQIMQCQEIKSSPISRHTMPVRGRLASLLLATLPALWPATAHATMSKPVETLLLILIAVTALAIATIPG